MQTDLRIDLDKFQQRAAGLPREASGNIVAGAGTGKTTVLVERYMKLVEDDGESSDYRRGVVARTRLVLRNRAANRLRLEIGGREGPFEVPERPLRVCIHGCPTPRSVRIDAIPLEAGEGLPGWTAAQGRVQIRLHDRGQPHALEIEPSP